MPDYKYKSQANRDTAARELRAQGRTVRKRSVRNVSLSPDYVADATPDEGCPNGFGGRETSYYPVLYVLEVR